MVSPRFELDVWRALEGPEVWHWAVRRHDGIVTRVERQGRATRFERANHEASEAREQLGLTTTEIREAGNGFIADLIPLEEAKCK